MIDNNPIETRKNDVFHFYPFSKKIARVISSLKDNEGSVIAIEGKWGSGKTSFINLILEELQDQNTLVVKMNPWFFSNPNELIKDFFNSIMNALLAQDKKNIKNVKKIGQYAYKLLKLSEVKIVPEINILGAFTIKFGEIKSLESTLAHQTDEINKLLLSFQKKIIIFADDIDRLDKEETQLIFKLIKITSVFSNIRFILGYDREIVCERLDSERWKGEELLKKIIHLSFPLPKPNKENIFLMLCSSLEKMIRNFGYYADWEDKRWEELSGSSFKRMFSNVRDVKNYVNGIWIDLEVMEKLDRNLVDFIALTAIRIFVPEVYVELGNEKKLFTSLVNVNDTQDLNDRKEKCEKIFRKSPPNLIDVIRDIICQLFPQIKAIYLETEYKDNSRNWKKELRICSQDNFDRYFNSFILPDAVYEESGKALKEYVELA